MGCEALFCSINTCTHLVIHLPMPMEGKGEGGRGLVMSYREADMHDILLKFVLCHSSCLFFLLQELGWIG